MFNILTVRFGGPFDRTSVPELRRTLAALDSDAHLVIDCTGVAEIDVEVLWVLVSESSRRLNGAGSLFLSNVSADVECALREIGAGSLLLSAMTAPIAYAS
jgi:anti-anti-sigma regulatory factor